jgi:hypothetical protein
LPGTREDHHAGAAGVERLRGALGQFHALDDQRGRRLDLLARTAGLGLQRQGQRECQQRGNDGGEFHDSLSL